MPPSTISFRASDLSRDQTRGILDGYAAVEQARTLRRLLTVRCGLMALGVTVVGLGFNVVSAAVWVSIAAAVLALPVGAWILEIRRSVRLARRLGELPPGVLQTPAAPPSRKS